MSYIENRYTNNKKEIIKYAKNVTNLNFDGYST